MNKTIKRILAASLALTIAYAGGYELSFNKQSNIPATASTTSNVKWKGKTPKYIFMFIENITFNLIER